MCGGLLPTYTSSIPAPPASSNNHHNGARGRQVRGVPEARPPALAVRLGIHGLDALCVGGSMGGCRSNKKEPASQPTIHTDPATPQINPDLPHQRHSCDLVPPIKPTIDLAQPTHTLSPHQSHQITPDQPHPTSQHAPTPTTTTPTAAISAASAAARSTSPRPPTAARGGVRYYTCIYHI